MKKKISPLKTELDYQCLLINSPKALAEYQKSEVEEERKFLGYEFSTSRNKSGTKILGDNLAKNYSPLIKKMFLDDLRTDEIRKNKETTAEEGEMKLEMTNYSRVVILKDIILNDYKNIKEEDKVVKEGNICAFYPRYVKKIKKEDGFYLKEVCKVNKHNKNEVTGLLEYIQIGNLKENEIKGKLKTDSKS